MAISAWKSTGQASWALRVNPSSGNLHPTEGYLICGPITGLCDTPVVCHYAPKEHGVEVRAAFSRELWAALWPGAPATAFLVGLTSIHWREAWKYGQRAYRYCQHDAGHAIGAISIAAAGLGWQTRILDDLSTDELALLMGTGRASAEPEEPDLLIALAPYDGGRQDQGLCAERIQAFGSLDWRGTPNQLSPSHVDWGVEDVAAATRKPRVPLRYEHHQSPPIPWCLGNRPVSLRKIIRQRRSAVAMDRVTRMTRDAFYTILERTLPVPFSTLPWTPLVHLAIVVHRVDDLATGLYVLVRDPSQRAALEKAFTNADRWQRPAGCPPHLALYHLIDADVQQTARQVCVSRTLPAMGASVWG